MTARPGASHRRDVVHPHRMDTLAILVASTEPCITLAKEDALKQTGRRFAILLPGELASFPFPASWAMGVVLCPGDDTEELAAWARKNPQPDRVSFHLHPKTDARKALAAWHRAGLPVTNAWEAAKWADLASKFGAHLNSVCHDDFCKDAGCRFRDMR